MGETNVTNVANIPFTSYMGNPYMMCDPTANYAANVGYLDLTSGLTGGFNAGLSNVYNPLSMNCGIFPGMGMYGGMCGGMYGMYGGYQNPQAYAQAMTDYNRTMATGNMQLNSDLATLNMTNQNNFKISSMKLNKTFEAKEAETESGTKEIAYQGGRIRELLSEGKFTQAAEVFNKEFKNAICKENQEYGYVTIEENKKTPLALDKYKQIFGVSLADDIRKYGGSHFWTGVKMGAGCGLGSVFMDGDPQEFLDTIEGRTRTNSDYAKRNVGIGTSAAVTGALGVLLLPLVAWCVGKGAKEWGKSVWKLYTGKAFRTAAI